MNRRKDNSQFINILDSGNPYPLFCHFLLPSLKIDVIKDSPVSE